MNKDELIERLKVLAIGLRLGGTLSPEFKDDMAECLVVLETLIPDEKELGAIYSMIGKNTQRVVDEIRGVKRL